MIVMESPLSLQWFGMCQLLINRNLHSFLTLWPCLLIEGSVVTLLWTCDKCYPMQVPTLTGDSHSQVKAAVANLLLVIGPSSLQSLCNIEIFYEIFAKSLWTLTNHSVSPAVSGPVKERETLTLPQTRFYCLISCMLLLHTQLVDDGQ